MKRIIGQAERLQKLVRKSLAKNDTVRIITSTGEETMTTEDVKNLVIDIGYGDADYLVSKALGRPTDTEPYEIAVQSGKTRYSVFHHAADGALYEMPETIGNYLACC